MSWRTMCHHDILHDVMTYYMTSFATFDIMAVHFYVSCNSKMVSRPGETPTFRAPQSHPKSTPTSATGFREPPYKPAWPQETPYTTVDVFPVYSVLFNHKYPARAGIPLRLWGLTSMFRTLTRQLGRPRSPANRFTTIFVLYILDIDSHCPYLLSGETTSHLTSKWRGTFQYFQYHVKIPYIYYLEKPPPI